MLHFRLCIGLLAIVVISTPAFAKNETLAERGKRLCAEAGVPLEDCKVLPPSLRQTKVAATEPVKALGVGPAKYGTGKYGWCDDCTSVLAAAPVTPWETFSGRQWQPIRDEDDRQSFADAGDASDEQAGSDDGDSDDNGSSDDGDGGDDGDSGDDDGDSGNGGESDNGGICN